VLSIELASRESASIWKELLLGERKRSLNGVEFVVSDDHAGLRRAFRKFYRKPSGNVAMCIPYAACWIIVPVKLTMIV
jgi:transposase-like protein